MGMFDGKVVAITGAGGGLGRAYAHSFAKEGAQVVVNDLGGPRDGSGDGSSTMAEQVVAEIEEMGGKAVPNFANVADVDGAKSIITSAVDAFGKLDILVNNAGILRDKTLVKMTPELWDLIMEVHLRGTYLCSRAASLRMISQKSGGRIINTTSLAGLMGNYGQTNYAAAKAGIAGFTRTAALELRRPGITVNAIGPIAKTRLTDDIDLIDDDAKCEFISPMVMFLASDLAADVTGRIFGVHSNHIFEYKMEMTRGVDKSDEAWEVTEIADRFEEICKTEAERVKEELKNAPAGAAVADPGTKALTVFEAMITAFMPDKAKNWKANLHFEVNGCGEFTMNVADGKVGVAKGLNGDATCVIKLADDVFFGMAEGKVDGTQAFMQGKIKATNMGDMVKYGTCFHQKKAEAAVKAALAELAAAGGGAAMSPADKAFAVLEATSSAFMPEKAKKWKANLHFEIADCGELTMKVADGAVSVAKGLDGDPTCVIKMADDIFFGMAEGKVDGTQAFMQGKITATNMGDMVKYGTCFHQKKAQAAVKEALAKAAAAGPAAAVDPATKALKVLEATATAFMPEKAKKWKANLHFKISDCGELTMKVADGAVSAAQGLDGDATCVIELSDEVFFGMAEGKVDGTQAFMQGKIKASNMKDMVKYGTCFHQKRAQAAVKEVLASLSGSAPAAEEAAAEDEPRPVGLNRDCLGKVYLQAPAFVAAEHTIAYAKATNDANPVYLDESREGGIIAPVLFPTRLFYQHLEQAVLDPELNADVVMLLHGEQDMRFFAPIRPGDLIEAKGEVAHMEKKDSGGELLDIKGSCLRDGKVVAEAVTRCFIRDRDAEGKKKKAKKEQPKLPELAFTEEMKVREDQSLEYAEASLDRNPIHVDPEVGKGAGYGGVIIHGLCTMAFSSQAIVKHAAGGDPTKLKRLKVRFSRPVKPGEVVTTQAWKTGEKDGVVEYGYRMVTGEGELVVTDGVAEVAK